MNISKTDSTNFRATMNISQMKNYKHYWQEVANNFANKTADKEAAVSLLKQFDAIGFSVAYDNKNKFDQSLAYISCTKDCFYNMTNESPANTADKLVKVFDFLTTAKNKRTVHRMNFLDKVIEEGLKAKDIERYETLYKEMILKKNNVVMKEINKEINKTQDLKGFEIFI